LHATFPVVCGDHEDSHARTRVLEALEDGVLVLTLNRPERKNAFDETMWRGRATPGRRALTDDAVRLSS
jgi:enoyl-CoA hydratase/carnithine racemase